MTKKTTTHVTDKGEVFRKNNGRYNEVERKFFDTTSDITKNGDFLSDGNYNLIIPPKSPEVAKKSALSDSMKAMGL